MQQQALQIHQHWWGIIELRPRGIRVIECRVSLYPSASNNEQQRAAEKCDGGRRGGRG